MTLKSSASSSARISHPSIPNREQQGVNFRIGEFHDKVISYGSLPLSVIEWLLLDDPSSLTAATH